MRIDSAIFYTNDIKKAVEFYRDVLVFTLDYQQGEMYASFVFADGGRLGIKKKSEEREVPGAQTIMLAVEDIHALYESLKNKQADFYKDMAVFDWGTSFSVLDPDRNKIVFVKRPQPR